MVVFLFQSLWEHQSLGGVWMQQMVEFQIRVLRNKWGYCLCFCTTLLEPTWLWNPHRFRISRSLLWTFSWIFGNLKMNSCWKAGQKSFFKKARDSETDLGRSMEGYGYEHFGVDGAMESQQADYRRIVGDTQPPREHVSSRECKLFVRQTSHSHGHETAAQRYSATRIQAGLGPER